MPDAPLDARFTLTQTDYDALCDRYARLTPRRRAARLLGLVLPFVIAAAACYFAWMADWTMAAFYAGLAALLVVVNVVLTPWSRRRSFQSQRLGEQEVTLSADAKGFRSATALVDASHHWDVIRHVDYTDTHVIMWPNQRIGYIVPLRGFASEAAAGAFVALVREAVEEKPL